MNQEKKRREIIIDNEQNNQQSSVWPPISIPNLQINLRIKRRWKWIENEKEITKSKWAYQGFSRQVNTCLLAIKLLQTLSEPWFLKGEI